MGTSLISAERRTARRKGLTAAAVAGGSLVIAVLGAPVVGVAGLVGAGYLTVNWFKYRAAHGLRF